MCQVFSFQPFSIKHTNCTVILFVFKALAVKFLSLLELKKTDGLTG